MKMNRDERKFLDWLRPSARSGRFLDSVRQVPDTVVGLTEAKKVYGREANEFADRFGLAPSGDWLGGRDAFRHAYTAGRIAQNYGQGVSNILGIGYEIYEYQTLLTPDGQMDIANDLYGSSLGAKAADRNSLALDVWFGILGGETVVVDRVTNPEGKTILESRNSDYRDVEHISGDRLEDRYRPDRGDYDNVGPGDRAGSGTMVA